MLRNMIDREWAFRRKLLTAFSPWGINAGFVMDWQQVFSEPAQLSPANRYSSFRTHLPPPPDVWDSADEAVHNYFLGFKFEISFVTPHVTGCRARKVKKQEGTT
jgi:hypothetical protein